MRVLSEKKYNELQTQKWSKDCDKARDEGRHWSMMPQLAFYLFNPQRRYGYVAYDGRTALWDKTKKGVIELWESEQRKRKIRGY